MNVSSPCLQILDQLKRMVAQLEASDFSRPSEALSGSTIGQHLRHTLEFFICLQHGFEDGVVNYDKRNHDRLIEEDKFIALAAIDKASVFVDSLKGDKSLKLEVGYDVAQEQFVSIDTNLTRELVYNIEHAVHHMAIMKIGIREVAPYVVLPSDFGVAASTLRFKDKQVSTTLH